MDLWPRKFIFLLLFYCGCSAIDEGKPYFISRNFNTVLHWRKADSLGEEVLYSVQYARYGEEYKPKLGCQKITALLCDLTAETPYIYSHSYRARVYANGHLLGQTVNFNPLRETVLGPPIVSVIPTKSSIKVTVMLPLGPNNRTSIEEIFNSTSFSYHIPPTIYTLTITHPSWASQVRETRNGEFVINNLRNNNTEYCGYVHYKPTKEPYRPASENQAFCVTLPGDRWLLIPWFLLFVCLLLCFLLPALVVFYQYVRKTSDIPETLKLRKTTSPPSWHIPEAIIISIAKPDPMASSCDVQKTDDNKGSRPYFQQKVQPWHSNSYKGQQGPPPDYYNDSTESSANYSMVVVEVNNNKAKVERECHQEREVNPPWSADPNIRSDCMSSWGERGPDGFSCGALPEPDGCLQNSDVVPIVLPTCRRTDGQLLLSTLLFQPEPRTTIASWADAEGQPLLLDPGRTQHGVPLLSDIVMMDKSECFNYDAGKENEVTSFEISSYAPQQTWLNQQQNGDKEEGKRL
ncbi:interferon lambda receptor 1 [Esox lucius]|uniref:Fibronectin type-III domain-containing protein n=1 Tax=Esox lucius TaxID=8010 RepID=A0AAY5KZE7_ESOLU|nr:interferon lambda receptor 1 [Esox lucius]